MNLQTFCYLFKDFFFICEILFIIQVIIYVHHNPNTNWDICSWFVKKNKKSKSQKALISFDELHVCADFGIPCDTAHLFAGLLLYVVFTQQNNLLTFGNKMYHCEDLLSKK